jgi:hypothetical protein
MDKNIVKSLVQSIVENHIDNFKTCLGKNENNQRHMSMMTFFNPHNNSDEIVNAVSLSMQYGRHEMLAYMLHIDANVNQFPAAGLQQSFALKTTMTSNRLKCIHMLLSHHKLYVDAIKHKALLFDSMYNNQTECVRYIMNYEHVDEYMYMDYNCEKVLVLYVKMSQSYGEVGLLCGRQLLNHSVIMNLDMCSYRRSAMELATKTMSKHVSALLSHGRI